MDWSLILVIPALVTGHQFNGGSVHSHDGPTYAGSPVMTFVKQFPSKKACASAGVNDYSNVVRDNPSAYYICAKDLYVIANHPAPKQ